MTARSVLTGGRTLEIAKDDWRSSDQVLDPVRQYAPIDTDPCASDDPADHFARINITRPEGTDLHPPVEGKACKCDACVLARLRRRTEGGLAARWEGWSYVNPEFSEADAWVAKCIVEAVGSVSVGLLLPARIGSQWYRSASANCDAVAEWKGRIKFRGAKHAAMFPTVLFGFNVSWRRFAAAFGDVADIVVPMGRAA